MVIQNKQYVEIRSDDPLEAVIDGRHYKAYLVANLAFNQGAEVSAEHYGLTLAEVHGAMAFYYENEKEIEQAIVEVQALGENEMNLRNRLDKIKNRLDNQ